MTSLMEGLRAMRANEDRGDGHHQPRQRPQIKFVQVDPDEHQRKVQAERAALMREREIEERSVARLKAEADAQSRKQNGEPKAKPPGRPRKAAAPEPVQPNETPTALVGVSAAAAKSTPRQEHNRYAHLHEDAVRVWFYVTEHNDAALSLSEIAGVLGLTVSEVSHRLRQLENNGVVRRGYDGVITLLKRGGGAE